MKCGVAIGASNDLDLPRVRAEDWSRPPSVPDHEIWHNTIELGELIEPLGYDSIWVTEHHSSPYGMSPNGLQILAFWAGRTKRVDVGTMVVIAPWWNPVRLAHEIAMLDILLTGRHYTLGLGRGLSPKEYGALGIPQGEARQRFDETVDILRLAFTKQRFSYDGKIFKIPETSLRPQPHHPELVAGAMGAFMTEGSRDAIAGAGLGHIVNAGQSIEQIAADNMKFNEIRAHIGLPPTRPIVHLAGVYCTPTEAEAQRGFDYLKRGREMTEWHYGFTAEGAAAFAKIPGYEAYAKMHEPGGTSVRSSRVSEFSMVGTPEQIIDKITRLQRKTGCREVVLSFCLVGSTPKDEVERSMRLFAKDVLPHVHAIKVDESSIGAVSA